MNKDTERILKIGNELIKKLQMFIFSFTIDVMVENQLNPLAVESCMQIYFNNL